MKWKAHNPAAWVPFLKALKNSKNKLKVQFLEEYWKNSNYMMGVKLFLV